MKTTQTKVKKKVILEVMIQMIKVLKAVKVEAVKVLKVLNIYPRRRLKTPGYLVSILCTPLKVLVQAQV